jgi:hypothetical protein
MWIIFLLKTLQFSILQDDFHLLLLNRPSFNLDFLLSVIPPVDGPNSDPILLHPLQLVLFHLLQALSLLDNKLQFIHLLLLHLSNNNF